MKKEGNLRAPEISLKLCSYDDIFSDFDARLDYTQRSMSVDFLDEIERASKDKEDRIELNFMVPRRKRNKNSERQINKRLKDHFKKHFLLLEKEKHKIIKSGIIFAIAGIIIMFMATLISYYYQQNYLITSFLIILLEPGGWFLFWSGLDEIVFKSKKINPKLEFYRKMHKSMINFFSE